MPSPRLAATALALAVLVPGTPARAHATLDASEPAEGAVLSAPPRQVTLRFSDPSRITMLRLLGERGQEVGLRREAARGTPTSATATVTGAVAPGSYRLEWRAVAPDGHVMTGTVAFTVGAP